jgi:hypothetical protein
MKRENYEAGKFMRKIRLSVGTLIFALLTSLTIAAQNDESVSLPKPEQISKITFAPLSAGETPILTRQSLLAMLPHLIPGIEPAYFSDMSTQDGTFTLKDGKVLEWSSVDGESLFLTDGKKSQLFFVFSENVEKRLTLPTAEEISKVSFSPAAKKGFTKNSLLKILPKLVPSNKGFYPGRIIQRGTLTLNDGTILRWTTAGNDHLVLRDGKKKRLYSIDYRGELTIPKAEDVSKINTSPPSDEKWFTPESLLKALPKFVPGGSYQPKRLWQYGYIELKTGVTINWRADSRNTLVLYNRGGETYFQLPPEIENAVQAAPKITRKTIFRGSIENDFFQMSKKGRL